VAADKAVLGLGIGPTTMRLEWGPSGLCFAWMTQPLPTLGPVVPDNEAVAAAIGVQLGDLAGGHLPVQVASSGVPFLEDEDTKGNESPLHVFLESVGRSRVDAHMVCVEVEAGRSVQSVFGTH